MKTIDSYTAPQFDVAMSFSRSERALARRIARCLRATGIAVYFDEWSESETTGRLLTEELKSIYFRRSRHCIVLVSPNYRRSRWPRMEWAAIASRVQEAGHDFLTVVSIDGARLDAGQTTQGISTDSSGGLVPRSRI